MATTSERTDDSMQYYDTVVVDFLETVVGHWVLMRGGTSFPKPWSHYQILGRLYGPNTGKGRTGFPKFRDIFIVKLSEQTDEPIYC